MSYAMDLDVEVAPTSTNRPQRLMAAKIAKGVLITTYALERTQSYVIKNSADRDKKVLIEYPLDNNWTLAAPEEPTEKTRDMYRFAVEAKPGVPADLKITEERTLRQDVAMSNLNDDSIRILLSSQQISQRVKDALSEVVSRKAAISDLVASKEQVQTRITEIEQTQDRMRQNIQAIRDTTIEVYGTWVKMFTEQEDQLTEYRNQVKSLDDQIKATQSSLDAYLLDLVLE